jgi:HlyD family secretion protein
MNMRTPPNLTELPTVSHSWRNRLPSRKVGAAAAAIVLVIGGVAAKAAAGSSGSGGYRTATVGTQGVAETLREVGIIEPVSQGTITFPIAGTVSTVDVAVGDSVTLGQTLATLDTAALEVTIHEAQAALDQAELTLERALNGETVTPGGATGLPATGVSSRDPYTVTLAGLAQEDTDTQVAAAQQAVLQGQQEVDTRLLAAQDALDTADEICAAIGQDTPSTTTTTTTTTTVGEATTTSAAGEDGTRIEACRSALQTVLTAQQATYDAQSSLNSAASALDALIARRLADAQAQAQADTGTQTPSNGQNGLVGSQTGQDSTGQASGPAADAAVSSSPSSADLIAYQAAVDSAAATLAVAQQALKQATIVTPMSGTVAGVTMAPGDSVEATSTTASIVVIGDGGFEVTTTVSVADLPDIELGQAATMQPDGTDTILSGEVVSIGVAATSTNGSTTYPVTVGLDDPSAELRNGSIASVAIVTDSTSDALVVPTSAVHVEGAQHTVTVLEDGTTKDVDVEVGAVGATWTEITSGLTAGQRVVLADLNEALPGSATTSSGNRDSGTGVRIFGGGGAFPGGRGANR